MNSVTGAAPPAPLARIGSDAAPGWEAAGIQNHHELTHRRLTVLVFRRVLRVLTLHALDAALLTGAILLLASLWPRAAVLRHFAPALVTIVLLTLNAFSAYDPADARRDWKRLASATLLSALILTALAAFPPFLPLHGAVMAAFATSAVVALMAGRMLADQAMRQVYRHGLGLRRAVIVGTLDDAGRVIQRLRDHRNLDQFVVGHLAPEGHDDPTALAPVATLPQVLWEQNIQEVLVASVLPHEAMERLARCCFAFGSALYIVPTVAGVADYRSEPLRIAHCSLLQLHPVEPRLPARWLKRIVDLMGALVLLAVFAPVMLLVALAIWMEGSGPVLFRQTRLGVGGRAFTILKFRTMRPNAEEVLQRDPLLYRRYVDGNYKLPPEEDPRLSPLGLFLRRTSLDELPQLFNVLSGEMSLVGPRPIVVPELQEYGERAAILLGVKPGLTGYWQVSGRSDVGYPERADMELFYATNWTFGMDLGILLRTVPLVLRRQGAF